MHGYAAGMRLLATMKDVPTPAPAPAPSPAPPTDPPTTYDIDFSKMDTPQKAAVMPSLNPAVVATIANGVFASMAANQLMPINIQLALGASTPATLQYNLVPADKGVSIAGQGQIGGVPFQEKWTVDEKGQAFHLDGTLGDAKECLTLTVDQKTNAAHVDGKIGDVEVHQTLSQGGTSQNPYLIADGTLCAGSNSKDAVALHQEVKLDPSNPNQPRLTVNGNLGDKPIQVVVTETATDKSMVVHGEGNIGGTAFKLDNTMGLKKH